MNEQTKRILMIAGFIILVGGMGYALYYFFFRTPPATPVPVYTPQGVSGQLPQAGGFVGSTTTGQGGGQGLPGIGSVPQNLQLPSNAPAESPQTQRLNDRVSTHISLAQNGNLRGYNQFDGKFYKISSDGQSTLMSNQAFPDVQDVRWGNVSDKAVMMFPDGSKILYDFAKQQQSTLPKHWDDFGFSPNDAQVAAKIIGNNDSNRFLTIANPDGTGAKLIAELGDNHDKVHVSWSPNDQMVAYSFTGDPLGYNQQAIVMVGKHEENFKNLIVEGRGFVPNWSPSGNALLYSVWNSDSGYRPTLWVSGANSSNINDGRRSFSLNTWADKCAWQAEDTIVCAVPTEIRTGSGLQRSLQEGVPDTIVKMNVNTGATVNLGQPQGNPTIMNPVISKDGSELYYGDPAAGGLYKFRL